MSKVIIFVFSIVGLFSVCVGQVIQDGQCTNLPIFENFNIQEFLGKWYEFARTDNPNQQGDCSALELTRSNNELEVYYSSVNNNFFEDAKGTASQDGNTARLQLTISSLREPIDFWVRDTDYATFAITFSCANISPTQRKVHIWVLTRLQESPSEMALAFISTTILNTFGIVLTTLRPIDQSVATCYVLPVIEPGEPIIFPGECDENLAVVQNFDVDRFLGLWHQISSYETPNAKGACVRAEYSRGNGVVNVFNSQVVDQKVLSIDGYATVSGTDAKLSVTLNIPGAPSSPRELWILRSDYDHYAIAYTCENIGTTHRRVYSWILSRTRQLPPSSEIAVDDAIRSYLDLNSAYYQPTDQSDAGCFFYPEPTDQPVVFRGQCESVNVQAIPNFEADRYMGRWHNIEMYPSRFQDGSCSNAFYELADGSVNVVNSQVNDQRLETVKAVAVPASDGSAKLVVTFSVPGSDQTVSTDYWVLGTDYSNYAFVYTCQNLDKNEMQVVSWKLSRTKQLLPGSELAINEIMSTIPYLDDRYYKKVDQTEAGCFYFPEPQDNVPVVFPGQCDETVGVVQNFNFANFEGTWYDIESYPKAERTGQCVEHQFNFVDNARLNLVSSSVRDQFQGQLNGVVTRSSATDNSGKLTITITDANGQAKNIPFWVLATNYNDFAFAYACENIEADFRAVWSWKLSKTRELSTAAIAAINNAMTNIDVLQDNYFEKIDHSDEACFFLPELVPGVPVILPGQCDSSITGIPNLNIEKYAGRWHLIESYGSDFQDGTCNVARYTQQGSNILAVTNSQVVNEQLASISGTATITSTDGSGQLTINFGGELFNVIILDTDYDSYSLSYSCVNLPETNQRRVYSWKMSRENTLSENAINSINQNVDKIQVLNNRYYYRIDHSHTGCFYFPIPDSSSSVRFRGQCDQNIPVMTNFQAARYLGRWYDIESYPGDFQNGKCNTATYSEHPEPGIDVDVYNTQVINQALFSIRGTAVQEPSTDGSAKLTVTFSVGGTAVTANYWVLATDYDSYALVYSCQPVDDEYVQVTSWKLSKTRELTSEAKVEIDKVMSNIRVLDQRYFIERDHTREGCFYFPEAQTGLPVVFPGQCDNSIAAVPNFNMNNFQGTWHEIAGYPKANQDGQCISQQFTVNTANSMRLDSFSVLDLTQSTTEGHVTFASDNDLSGKLEINILVNGEVQSIPYWILSTDYTDYALAYSCVNIDKDYRGVWSWKLSKTRQLTDESNAAINEAIAKVDVLRNDYYENIQQTDSACFHLPDFTPGDTVVLPGQCDTSIGGKPNFDIARYAGEWRLIESYGSRYQSGTCNVARYTQQASNTLGVTNSQVVNEQLASISGTATMSSTDGSGRLTFNLRSREYVMYILETDYDSFALAYGCANSGNNQRRVTSWKFSRSNTLSQDATNRINQIINDIEVLHQPYYYQVNRSPDACFYFPEPDRNTPVRFRGQCDESIPVVPNFQAVLYAGTWYDVESYPTNFQSGTCNTATYTVNSDGTLDVKNTQVVDQLLQTATGFAEPTTSDGSAKFDVILTDSSGTDIKTKYWVLATDYETYSFVYSCRNIDEENREVYSWKLGKEPIIPEPAATTINSVIGSVQVLSQQYYVPRSHTNEACFYYPDNNGGDVILNGQCLPDAEVPVVTNFNANAFSGIWHEVSRFPSALQNGECTATEYALNGGNNFDVVQTSVVVEEMMRTVTQASVASDGRGVISIDVDGVPFDVYILGTDYNEYALAYSCRNLNADRKQIFSWKLSKTRAGLSEAANNAINELVSNNIDLHESYYRKTGQDHAACFYYPVFDQTPLSIELPGPCDESITGVSNFNVLDYLGTWYEVARYPQRAQTGQCNRAEFTTDPNSGTITIVNSQVFDEALAKISGEATVTANDGEIEVTFKVGDETRTAKYFVLATDYNSYALLYSCITIESGERRRVGSWKLSRTTQLSPLADTAIDATISATQGLRRDYYQDTNQSAAACFHYPVFEEPPPYIELPGTCDTSITGIANFNVENFVGQWFEVARYPHPEQTGQCNVAEFENGATSGTLSVVISQILGESLSEIRGEAEITSSDGAGDLRVTYTDHTAFFSEYHVLATDYTGFALVYACSDTSDLTARRVGSWKLSRTTQLSPLADTAIDATITATQGLRRDYYQDTNQSAAACFHYPVFEEPPPYIELPGTCDTSITGIANFNVENFVGQWFEVARYPHPEQTGQCNVAEFENGATSGTLSVVISQIMGESLSEIRGEAEVTSSNGAGDLRVTYADHTAFFSEYHVLATDYTGFALVYACSDTSDLTARRVGSWKLSRNVELSEYAKSVINDVISTTQGLKQEYYQDTIHTDQACFHYPTQTGDRVIIPGQCDNDISAVESFNVARFANNSWYQIKRYDAVGGSSCVGTRLSFDDNTRNIEVLFFEVVDEVLLTTEGSGQLYSNDGRGIFSLVMGDSEDGERTETTIYILATDYDGYALAYSCENINSNQRQVRTWQLSRGRTMTEAGTAAITEIIEERPEFYDEYFKSISQTEECLEPSSTYLFKSSIILIFVCTVLQLVW